MSLTGNIALDLIIAIILNIILAVVGTIAMLFVIAFVWTKIDEFFEKW